ncbi:hypothetical protein C0557_08890 [Kosakonia sp. MUSA4]|nr:hypothetical protein C0557_08890 [Kosakonia sp. MUSA4]
MLIAGNKKRRWIFHWQSRFYAVDNTFKRCNLEKCDTVQPIAKSYQAQDEFDVNAVLNQL